MFKKIISENKTSFVALTVTVLTLVIPMWSKLLQHFGIMNADSRVDTAVWGLILAILLALLNHRTHISIKYEGYNIDEESEIIISLTDDISVRNFKIILNTKRISRWGSRKKLVFTFPENISLTGNTKFDDVFICDNTINIPLKCIATGETTLQYAIALLEEHPSGSKQVVQLSDDFRLKKIKTENSLKIIWR